MGRLGYYCKKGMAVGGLWLLMAMTACTDGFEKLTPQGNLSLRLVAMSLEEQSSKSGGEQPLTRAGTTVDENTISHLWVLQFDGTDDNATLCGKSEYSNTELNPGDQTLKNLVVGKNQRLYFIANCDIPAISGLTNGTTLSDFKQISLATPDESSLFPTNGCVAMTGSWVGEIKSNADGSSPVVATIQMERTVARIDLTVKALLRNGESFRVSSVRLYNVPDKMWLQGASTDPFPTIGSFNPLAAYGDNTTTGNPPVSVRWYMPENRRGLGKAISSTDKTAANLNAVSAGQGDKATYVEIVGDYVSGGTTYATVYRNYLGGNSVTDYNIRRNSAYDITITIRGKNITDSRVKVYGQAYTSVVNPDEVTNNVNEVPVLDGIKRVRQTARDKAEATSALAIDGNATVRGFVYSKTVHEESALIWDAGGDVLQVREAASFGSGEFTATLTGLEPGETYYVRSAATGNSSTAYGPISTYKVPSVSPAANCLMGQPGTTVMFETKDGIGTLKEVDAINLLWQTRDDGTAAGNLPVAKAADLIYDAENKTVIVHLNPAVTAANTVLQGTKNGTPVWQWHVWVTPYIPQGAVGKLNQNVLVSGGRIQTYDVKYQTAVGGAGKAIMDRDLGSQAVSTLLSSDQVSADKSFHFGLLYQWGYALPWVPAQRLNISKSIPVYDINGDETTPAGFQTVAASANAWNINKTAADPCPKGWRVAPKGSFGDFVNYGVFAVSNTDTDAGRLYIQGGTNAWFFACGWRIGAGDGFTGYKQGGVWSSSNASNGNAHALQFRTDGDAVVEPEKAVSALIAIPVRCVQE